MFERLVIHNFQIHKKLTVDFDPYLTTIVGASDQGKSSVLRALRLVCCNLPAGTSFITHGEDQTRIVLKVDGRKITRTRSKTVNEYSLDGKVFKAFGQSVPDEIEQLLNLSDINWQRQHDAPFWFSLSAGQVSKELNSIINLGSIDDAMNHVASELRKARSSEDVTRQRLTEAEKRRDELEWTGTLNERLTALEQLYSKKEEIVLKRSRISDLIKRLSEYESRKVSRSSAIAAAANVLEAYNTAAESKERRGLLQGTIQAYKEREETVCRLKKEAANSSKELSEKTQGICPMCNSPMSV